MECGRWRVLWAAFFYLVLAYATFDALFHGSPGTRRPAIVLLVSALALGHT